jgi:hypothetical protein
MFLVMFQNFERKSTCILDGILFLTESADIPSERRGRERGRLGNPTGDCIANVNILPTAMQEQ